MPVRSTIVCFANSLALMLACVKTPSDLLLLLFMLLLLLLPWLLYRFV